MDIEDDLARGGYFTVYVEENGLRVPHVVYANSAFHAAHKIKMETGQQPHDTDVDGPYTNYMNMPAATMTGATA